MTQFSFKARDDFGNLIQGSMESLDKETVASHLLRKQLVPIQIEEKVIKSKGVLHRYLSIKDKIKSEDLILFCRQMHALSKAGIPIVRAVLGLSESSRGDYFKNILKNISRSLSRGNTLALALKNHTNVFTPLFINMIMAGESTGKLDVAFNQLVTYLELERETIKKVKVALRYPILVVIAIFVAIAAVNLLVIPNFAATFSRLGAELPLATIILLKSSNFFVNYWWLILIIITVLSYIFYRYINGDSGRYQWDRLKLKIPIVGKLIQRISLSRFTRTFSMLFSAGLPIIQVLDISSATVGNLYIENEIKAMKHNIERGDSLIRAARNSGMFTPLILQMISVGEESGALDKLLIDVSEFYDEEIGYDVERLSSIIEPMLLIFLGIMVLILMLGVFLPLWDLSDVTRR